MFVEENLEVVEVGILIIGIDGLEYNLVEELNLKNIKQEEYGFFEIREEYFHPKDRVPYTPIVWSSILTGKPPREHGVKTFYTYGRVLDFVRNLPFVKKWRNKRALLSKIGLKPKMKSVKGKTFLDKVKSTAVWVPAYNDKPELHLVLSRAIRMNGVKGYEKAIEYVHEIREHETFRRLPEKCDIFMTYFDVLDLYGHIWFVKYPRKLRKWYRRVDSLVGKIKSEAGALTLILSDHGMEESGDGVTGNHSMRAFWSLSEDVGWEPRDFLDYYPFVLRVVGG